MTNNIEPFSGFHKSVKSAEYQQFLEEKVNSVFGNKQSMSVEEFVTNEKTIKNEFLKHEGLGEKGFKTVSEGIAELDDNRNLISREEYKTFLAIVDAKLADEKSPLSMDGRFDIDKNNGMYKLDFQEDMMPYSRNLRWQKMSKDALIKEMKSKIQETLDSNFGGNGNNVYKLHDAITTASIYLSESPLRDTINTMQETLKTCFGDDIKYLDPYKTDEWPKWAPKYHSRTASLYYTETLSDKPLIIELDSFDQTCNYYYEVSGKSYPECLNMNMNWSRTIGYR